MNPSHPSPHIDHDKYVQGIRQKNALVLDDIYEDCFSEIVGWIMSKGVPEGKAEDLFQDSVEIFIRHCLSEDFVLTCSVRNYLYSVCRNKIREFYRSTDRQVVRISLIEHLLAEEQDLLVMAEAAERVAAWHALLRRTFEQLESRCRKIFEMVLQKKPAAEIAEQLHMPNANAVYQARFRCRDAWLRAIRADEHFEACKPERW